MYWKSREDREISMYIQPLEEEEYWCEQRGVGRLCHHSGIQVPVGYGRVNESCMYSFHITSFPSYSIAFSLVPCKF